ncbi:hypothetical protein QP888_02710 [Corynebacterium sp. MSK297]|uniref:hypothetical protein n=1 Tax=Corynebacterium sp. MSK297 TaxID=3050221 RepID=UPI00254A03B5|nr:hypothetical protein [Corynebacterium sp. MSK297]MDK8845439.1 hypothetical protein [Corynebacterium sp. MSK297]
MIPCAPAIIFPGQSSEWEKQLRNAAASHHAVGHSQGSLSIVAISVVNGTR